MLPTLRAAVQLGGPTPYQGIDALALDLAGISEEQRAIEYDETATASGPKILHRVAWARTMLKRIGALEGAGPGRWAPTELGVNLAAMEDEEAAARIRELLSRAYETVEPDSATLAEFKARAERNDPATLTVRDLISLWGASRRRSAVIDRVRSLLDEHGLMTDPDFTLGGLDTMVRIVSKVPGGSPGEAIAEEPPTQPETRVTLVVGNIPSAIGGVAAVNPQDDLLTAQSEMQAHDYSQLAVMNSPYNLVGAVSWESIAKARIFNPDAGLADCIDREARTVRIDKPLLETVPDISATGFVFVRDGHRKVTGIITVADLADQFAILTRPFLLVGEIERLLRKAVDRCFAAEDLYEALDPDDDREVEGAQSLTLGELQHLLEDPATFDRIGWRADRKVFIRELDAVRNIRNDVMHFSPDPPEEDDIKRLEAFSKWIRILDANVESA